MENSANSTFSQRCPQLFYLDRIEQMQKKTLAMLCIEWRKAVLIDELFGLCVDSLPCWINLQNLLFDDAIRLRKLNAAIKIKPDFLLFHEVDECERI